MSKKDLVVWVVEHDASIDVPSGVIGLFFTKSEAIALARDWIRAHRARGGKRGYWTHVTERCLSYFEPIEPFGVSVTRWFVVRPSIAESETSPSFTTSRDRRRKHEVQEEEGEGGMAVCAR